VGSEGWGPNSPSGACYFLTRACSCHRVGETMLYLSKRCGCEGTPGKVVG